MNKSISMVFGFLVCVLMIENTLGAFVRSKFFIIIYQKHAFKHTLVLSKIHKTMLKRALIFRDPCLWIDL